MRLYKLIKQLQRVVLGANWGAETENKEHAEMMNTPEKN